MKKAAFVFVTVICVLAITGCGQQEPKWAPHDSSRPKPAVISPADNFGQPPSDAIILFDGTDTSQWQHGNGEPVKWKVENGYMEVVKKTGDIFTKRSFGDCQLHIEWASPEQVNEKDAGQKRGNSGIFLMNNYEVQILDSYENATYADGQAAAFYGQYPPLVNASRKPGDWQSYDISFVRPRFKKNGKVARKGRITVFHNGVLVHNNVEILGETRTNQNIPHADSMPVSLQDHGNPIRFRNIWIRSLEQQ